MSFQSKAQIRKFRVLLSEGKISEKAFKEMEKESLPYDELPERLHSEPIFVPKDRQNEFEKCINGHSKYRTHYCDADKQTCNGKICEAFEDIGELANEIEYHDREREAY